ncbi:hypothetical protein BC939DRAFT_143845 [Gamsiella multidivaricata]|uniref:uncharacterized protein n=1 Tax=Gamsiella multidivaricata TaxID=101098 RepID=UPI0022208D88|nr:uncharacterized protein BC939DRAFT_143845 [Gamsiella multidivaricata]KAI7824410.1 hypothetical protein BC939DRAFT_143845 [Gamsiella multidivaricata]
MYSAHNGGCMERYFANQVCWVKTRWVPALLANYSGRPFGSFQPISSLTRNNSFSLTYPLYPLCPHIAAASDCCPCQFLCSSQCSRLPFVPPSSWPTIPIYLIPQSNPESWDTHASNAGARSFFFFFFFSCSLDFTPSQLSFMQNAGIPPLVMAWHEKRNPRHNASSYAGWIIGVFLRTQQLSHMRCGPLPIVDVKVSCRSCPHDDGR